MAKLFGIDIPKIVAQSLPGMLAGTLTKVTVGTRSVANPGGGTQPTTAAHAFKGFASTYKQKANALVLDAEHTVLIIADTCKSGGVAVEPKPQDKIAMTGDPQLGSKVLYIVDNGVERDPASATWTCHCKTLGG